MGSLANIFVTFENIKNKNKLILWLESECYCFSQECIMKKTICLGAAIHKAPASPPVLEADVVEPHQSAKIATESKTVKTR